MRYPKFLKSGDTIKLICPSSAMAEKDRLTYNNALKKLKACKYNILESEQTFNGKLISDTAENRAKEFSDAWKDESINAIISVRGGEFMMQILPFLKNDELKNSIKLFQGYSDNTILNHYLLTNLDIASIYHYTIRYFGMRNWHKSVTDSLNLLEGKEFKFESYGKYQNKRKENVGAYASFNLNRETNWKNARNEKEIILNGRMIGGCVDVLLMFLGTPFDKTKEFLEKYKNDGFIWFLESCDLTIFEMKRAMWQLRQNGYFKYVKGFIFGRPLKNDETELSYEDAVMQEIDDLNVPVIFEADIGHKPPTIPIFDGAVAKITSKNGLGEIEYDLK